MTRGMYAAAGGMLVGLTRQEVLSSNLANASTPGFKIDRASYGSYQKVLLPKVTDNSGRPAEIYQSATLNATRVDLRQGQLMETSSPLDVAVEGDGWLVVATPQGERYTRNGHLSRAADGTLVTSQGQPVLGEQGFIRLPDDNIVIDRYGNVSAGRQYLDRLRLVRFADPDQMVRQGETLVAGLPEPDFGSAVRQGWLEQSNTDTMRTMVEMIAVMRGFEMSQRVIQAQDQTLQSAIDIAKRS